MLPGLNGDLPASDTDTAWPHSSMCHQTLFDPGWRKASSDGVATTFSEVLFRLADLPLDSTHPRREMILLVSGGATKVGCTSTRIISSLLRQAKKYGLSDTVRLAMLKQKYDPHNGGSLQVKIAYLVASLMVSNSVLGGNMPTVA